MSIVKESLLFHLLLPLWRRLYQAYGESGVCYGLRRFAAWFSGQWKDCFLSRFVYRESRFTRDWDTCLLRRGLEWILNLPVCLLQWIYSKLQRLLDGSFFASLAFEMGRECYIAAGWFAALIMTIPGEYWNNGYSLLLFTLVTGLYLIGAMNRRYTRLSLKYVGPYLVLFFAAVVAAIPLSDYPELSARFIVYHIPCVMAVLVMVNAVEDSGQLLRLAGGLALGVLTSAGYGVYQRVFVGVAVNASYVDLTLNANIPGRVYSFFENPNALGQLLLFALPIMVALVFGSRRGISKLCAVGVFCVGLVCLVMTYCRAAWVGLAVAAVIYVFLWNRKLLPLFFVVGLAAIPLLPASVLNRILTIGNMNDSSTSSRFPLYAAALRLLKGDPITGAGLGTDAVRQTVRVKELYDGRAPFVHAHNTYLQVWIECGALGIVTFVGSILSMGKSTVNCVKRCPDPAARHMAIGGASALLGAAVCGLADFLWTYPRIMFIFWFVFGLTLAAIKVCKLEAERSNA